MAGDKPPPQRQFVALDWLSLASCSWAEPASVSPADTILVDCLIIVKSFRYDAFLFSFGFASFSRGGELARIRKIKEEEIEQKITKEAEKAKKS